MNKMDRRSFIGTVAAAGAAFLTGTPAARATERGYYRQFRFDHRVLAIASGPDPAQNTRAAVEALGGMKKLVSQGAKVVIKPNLAWNQAPEVAATTNPAVIRQLVKMCQEAGAGQIIITDHICDSPPESVFQTTGAAQVAQNTGATLKAAQKPSDFTSIAIPDGRLLTEDTCLKDILEADVFINVPVAKSHGAARLTLGMKNSMGCNWDRGRWHRSKSLDQCIADYASSVRPDLTVLDATRIMLRQGPKGPGPTQDVQKVIAGVDPVAVDAYGATLFDISPDQVKYIKLAGEMGLGEMDLAKMILKEV